MLFRDVEPFRRSQKSAPRSVMKGAGTHLFSGRDLESPDRIARHLNRGGAAVLAGDWNRIHLLHTWLASRGTPAQALERLLIQTEGEECRGVTPIQRVPHLDLLVRDRGQGFISLPCLIAARTALQNPHPVEALEAGLIVHRPVLVPRSQPLIHLLRRSMERLQPDLPPSPAILDMGCGSGVCSLLAARVWPGAAVVAADLLPEAIATTRTNVARFEAQGLIRPGAVSATQPGDLFAPVDGARFDLIIFNAPWVVAPVRSREEWALHDPGQRTMERFLAGARSRLTPGGRVLIGYADHSGPAAMANLEGMIDANGYRTVSRRSDRIRTHRHRRAWQTICAITLAGDRDP